MHIPSHWLCSQAVVLESSGVGDLAANITHSTYSVKAFVSTNYNIKEIRYCNSWNEL